MFEIGITLGFTVVSLLVSYLYLKHCQRVRPWREREEAWEWDGQVFDVTPIKPAIENVRRDYLAARAPAKGAGFHRVFLRLAQEGVARLAYFRSRRPEEEPGSWGQE
jgi:hypothetical protein